MHRVSKGPKWDLQIRGRRRPGRYTQVHCSTSRGISIPLDTRPKSAEKLQIGNGAQQLCVRPSRLTVSYIAQVSAKLAERSHIQAIQGTADALIRDQRFIDRACVMSTDMKFRPGGRSFLLLGYRVVGKLPATPRAAYKPKSADSLANIPRRSASAARAASGKHSIKRASVSCPTPGVIYRRRIVRRPTPPFLATANHGLSACAMQSASFTGLFRRAPSMSLDLARNLLVIAYGREGSHY